jgi:hypothetical protein
MLTAGLMALFIVAYACIAGPWSREMSRSLSQFVPVGPGAALQPHVSALEACFHRRRRKIPIVQSKGALPPQRFARYARLV